MHTESRPGPGDPLKTERLFDDPLTLFTRRRRLNKQQLTKRRRRRRWYKKRRLQCTDLSYKWCQAWYPPPPASGPNVFVWCHGDGFCVCGCWCHCGVGFQKRNQHLTGGSGNETCCVHTLVLYMVHILHTHTQKHRELMGGEERKLTF